jgi:hypothetical protein
VKSGKVKSDVVRSVGLVSETQKADLSPTESYGRSRVDLDPEYEVQEVRVRSKQSPKRKRGVGEEGDGEVRRKEKRRRIEKARTEWIRQSTGSTRRRK